MSMLSTTLAGFNNHLRTQLSGTHVNPTLRTSAGAYKAMDDAVIPGTTFTADSLPLSGKQTGTTPYGSLVQLGPDFCPFKPAIHGQFKFTKFNLIDKFGQAVCGILQEQMKLDGTSTAPHVIGLTSGGRDNPIFLLDTKLGVIYWPECVSEIRYNPSRELIEDDPYDFAPEEEAEWRADAPAWAINDFFEVLKNQFRELCFIPISPRIVLDVYTTLAEGTDGMIALLQVIYHEHGWPDQERYRKQECLEAVQKALEEQYPGHEDLRRDDE